MNNDLKYALQGVLLVIVFLIVVKVVDYSLSVQLLPEAEETNTDSYQPSSKNTNSKGKQLFLLNCAACHAVNKTLVGPALVGIEERVPDKKILYQWIRNNQKVLQSGNPYFIDLYNKYNKMPMNSFPSLTDEEIESILNFIKEESPQKSEPAPVARR
jgi:mono/diheme cytochrome c family protein